jgi:hypothetical protein
VHHHWRQGIQGVQTTDVRVSQENFYSNRDEAKKRAAEGVQLQLTIKAYHWAICPRF